MNLLLKRNSRVGIPILACAVLLFVFTGCKKDNENPTLSMTTVASGLLGPMGVETDASGNLWVTEGGTDTPDVNGDTHNDNGKVVVITPDGTKSDAVIHLSSYANVHSNELQGTVNLLIDGSTLYVLSGDYLYTVNISNFHPGDAPIDAATLSKEDIASVIAPIASPNNPENDSHPYNLIKGPDGDLYIADAGANAILHRKGVNNYVILAELPMIDNPSFPGLGGPTVQPVPTSIIYDGSDFLVTTLTGFPFPQGQSNIYKVSMTGNVSLYQSGFTMLVDQAIGANGKHLVVQYASSFNPASGYAPASGSLIWVDGQTQTVLADSLNQPTAIKQVNATTWYVTSVADGTVTKVVYE